MDKIMKDFKVKESWTYLFKEKNWGWKLLIPLALVAVVVVALLISIALLAYMRTFNLNPAIIIILACSIIAISFIVIFTITEWYEYEYTQIAIHARVSKLIFSENFVTIIKKAAKLFIVNFIYNIPNYIILGVLYVVLIMSVSANAYQSTVSYNGARTYSSGLSGVSLIIYIIIILFTLLIVLPYNVYIVQIAKARLVETNTLMKALKFNEVFGLIKNNFGQISKFVGIIVLYFVLYFGILVIFTILNFIPLLGCCLFPLILILDLAIVFFGTFVYPYMVGSMYKSLKK